MVFWTLVPALRDCGSSFDRLETTVRWVPTLRKQKATAPHRGFPEAVVSDFTPASTLARILLIRSLPNVNLFPIQKTESTRGEGLSETAFAGGGVRKKWSLLDSNQ